jgi:hypothetical protein
MVKKYNKHNSQLLIPLYSTLVLILALSGLLGGIFIIIAAAVAVLGFIYSLLDRSRKVLESNKESVSSKINDAYKNNIENIENRNILSKFENDFVDREIIFKHGSWNLFLSGFFIALIIGILAYIPLNLDSIFILIIIAFMLIIFLIPTIANFEQINKMENVTIKSLHPSTDFIEIIKTNYKSLWF